MNNELIENYVNNLLQRDPLSFPPNSDDVLSRAQIKKDLTQAVEDVIFSTITEELNDQQRQQFSQLLNSGDMSLVSDFLKTNIQDLDAKIAAALAEFEDGYFSIS